MQAPTARRHLWFVAVLAVAVTTIGCTPTTPTTPTTETPAQVGLRRSAVWLTAQFGPSGLMPSDVTPTSPDLGNSVYAVQALKLAKRNKVTAQFAMAALESSFEGYARDASNVDRAGGLARLILSVVAVGGNPRSYAGSDLVARLEATMRRSGAQAGLFGSQDPTFDGAFRQGLALAALSLVSPRPASINPGSGSINSLPAVKWLRDQQCPTGAWTEYRTSLAIACATSGLGAVDTNATALATLGLKAVGATTVTDPHAWFTSVRSSDGGWSLNGGTATTADPDSTALVMAAERALGRTVDTSATTRLLAFQFAASASASDAGSFWYPFGGTPTPNRLATEDAALGLTTASWPQALAASW